MVSKKRRLPLPQVNAALDKLQRAKYLSAIDLKNGYWQVRLTPESRQLFAFAVPSGGLMEFKGRQHHYQHAESKEQTRNPGMPRNAFVDALVPPQYIPTIGPDQ